MVTDEKEDPTKYLPKNNHVPSDVPSVESQLDRIERKLDALIATYYKESK